MASRGTETGVERGTDNASTETGKPTWMNVMALVRALDEKRRAEGRLSEADADRLVTMLLDFHKQTIARTPSAGDMSPVVPSSSATASPAAEPGPGRPPRRL